jgi:hypothetical protein
MVQPSTPAMRKLLELNFSMSFSRFAMHEENLLIVLDCTADMMHPNKLYFGLRELSLQADLQDDLLLSNFSNMQMVDSDHVIHNTETQKSVKYEFFVDKISRALELAEPLNPDTFSGGISYIYMNLLQQLHYILAPEGKLLEEIDHIIGSYWADIEKRTAVELNQRLAKQLRGLLAFSRSDVVENLYYTNGTFCRMLPPDITKVQEVIANSLTTMQYYRDTQQEEIANMVMMYGLTNAAYHNSLPQVLHKLVAVFMQVNHADLCAALGIKNVLYNARENVFSKAEISALCRAAVYSDLHRYPHLKFDTNALRYNSLLSFNQSFLEQLIQLNYNS